MYICMCGVCILSCAFKEKQQGHYTLSTRLECKKKNHHFGLTHQLFSHQSDAASNCKVNKQSLDRYHSRNYASIALIFVAQNSVVLFSTYFIACVIINPHCDISNFNSPKKQNGPVDCLFDCYMLACLGFWQM